MYCLMMRFWKNIKELKNHTAITLVFIVKLVLNKNQSKLAEEIIMIDNY